MYFPVDDSVIPNYLPPKHYAPELFEPGKKPAGAVRKHEEPTSLSKGLIVHLPFLKSMGTLTDTAEGKTLTSGTAQYIRPAIDGRHNVSETKGNESTQLPDADYLDVESITIAGWIRWDTGGNGYPCILEKDHQSNFALCADYNSTPSRFVLNLDGVRYDHIFLAPALSANKWHHMVASYKSGEVKGYIDGKEVALSDPTRIGAMASNSTPLHVGCDMVGTQNRKIWVDDVRMYNRAISPIEVKEIYSYGYAAHFEPVAPTRIVKKSDGLWIPDRKLEMPSLFEPGKKPTGDVEIDWDNPLTKGLVSMPWVTPQGIIDLVTGKPMTEIEVNTPLDIVPVKGEIMGGGGGTKKAVYSLPEEITSKAVTMYCRFQCDWDATNDAVCGLGESALNVRMACFARAAYDTRWQCDEQDGSNEVTLSRAGSADPKKIESGIFSNEVGRQKAYFAENDVIYNSHGSAQNFPNGFPDFANISLAVGNENGASAGGTLAGYVSCLMAFKVAKSDAEQISIITNPFQFLVPK